MNFLKNIITVLATLIRVFKCKHDLHDYHDSEEGVPIHFHEYTCKYCKKKFTI